MGLLGREMRSGTDGKHFRRSLRWWVGASVGLDVGNRLSLAQSHANAE